MRKIRKTAVAVGVAGALGVGALVAGPALAGNDDAPVDTPARYEQVITDDDEIMPNPNCTGTQERDRDRERDGAGDRDQLRIQMQERDCDGAQMRHQHARSQANGNGPGPGPGQGTGDCPYAPTD